MSRLFATVVVVMVVTLGVSLIGQTDVSGTWNAVVELELGSGEPVFVFTQDGEILTGTYEGTFGRAELRGRVLGDKIEFSFGAEGVGEATYTGTVTGDSMEGTCDYGPVGGGTWNARKSE